MEKKRLRIGFIGFGEVAQVLSGRMIEKGGEIVAYDKFPDRVSKKAEEQNVPLVKSLEELAVSCPLILSCLWPTAALNIAREFAPLLSPEIIYCDMNSISPETTSQIDLAVSSKGADFVKLAIMAAVLDRGYAVPILAGGGKAAEVAQILCDLGLNIQVMGRDPSQPAALKILRSVCLKGVVALAYEMLRGAEKYGITEQVFESASEAMSKASFKDTVGGWLASTAIHAKRRAGEMAEVIETLEAAGIRPVMAAGTKEIFEEIASLGLDEALDGSIPSSLDLILKK